MDWEQHKNEFFDYIIKNEKMLQRALKKNITYDPDIFDDVTADTIIRIAEYIMNKRVFIKDFKNMFFMAAKRQYISEQNKKRKRQQIENRDFFDNIFNGLEKREKQEDIQLYKQLLYFDADVLKQDDKYNKVRELLDYVEKKLSDVFLPVEIDIFLIYFILKSNKNGISYKKLSELTRLDLKYITVTIQKVKKAVRQDKEILELKKKLLCDDD